MNDEEIVEQFYLFPLEKRQAAGDLQGLQYVDSAVLWKGINYHIEGRGLDGHYEKNSDKDSKMLTSIKCQCVRMELNVS